MIFFFSNSGAWIYKFATSQKESRGKLSFNNNKKKKNPLQTKEITESKLKAIALAAESANAFYFRPHQLFFLLSPFNPNILELGFIVLKKKKKRLLFTQKIPEQHTSEHLVWLAAAHTVQGFK